MLVINPVFIVPRYPWFLRLAVMCGVGLWDPLALLVLTRNAPA